VCEADGFYDGQRETFFQSFSVPGAPKIVFILLKLNIYAFYASVL
jgi:hypothetical protein